MSSPVSLLIELDSDRSCQRVLALACVDVGVNFMFSYNQLSDAAKYHD